MSATFTCPTCSKEFESHPREVDHPQKVWTFLGGERYCSTPCVDAAVDAAALQTQLAENAFHLMGGVVDGRFDDAAEERGITPMHVAAAAIVEMCRQAFVGHCAYPGDEHGEHDHDACEDTAAGWVCKPGDEA